MKKLIVVAAEVLLVGAVAFAQLNQGPTILNGGITSTPSTGFAGAGPNNLGGPGLGRHDLQTLGGTALGCETCHLPHTAPSYGTSFLWAWKYLPTTNVSTYQTETNPSGALSPVPLASTNPGYLAARSGNVRSMLCLTCHDGTSMAANNIQSGNTVNGLPFQLLATGSGQNMSNEHPVDAVFPPSSNTQYVQPNLGISNGPGQSTGAVGRDQLPLWNTGASGTGNPGVECVSCHDPHNDYLTNSPTGSGGGVPFLRVANLNGTYLCRECHNQ
jgi:hypothetical protein